MSTNTPAELAPVIEEIAVQWDGCTYDAPGETIDIGDAIRRAGKRLMAVVSSEVRAESPHNPWRAFIENVIDGSNYVRTREYRELLAYIDGLLAENTALKAHKCLTQDQLADAPVACRFCGKNVYGGEPCQTEEQSERCDSASSLLAAGWALTDDEFDRLQDEYDLCGVDGRLRDFAEAVAALSAAPAQSALTNEQIDALIVDWRQEHDGEGTLAQLIRSALSASPQVPQQEQAACVAAGQAVLTERGRVPMRGAEADLFVEDGEGYELAFGWEWKDAVRITYIATPQPSQPDDSGQAVDEFIPWPLAMLMPFGGKDVVVFRPEQVRDAIRAALASTPQAAQPAPTIGRAATPEMIAAGAKAAREYYMATQGGNSPSVIWEAMYDAATASLPSPPAAPVEQDDGNAWFRLVWDIGQRVDCLASSFPDGNAHILRAIEKLKGGGSAGWQEATQLPPLTHDALHYAVENVKGGPKSADIIRQAWPFLADAYRTAPGAPFDWHHLSQRVGYAAGLKAGADLTRELLPAVHALKDRVATSSAPQPSAVKVPDGWISVEERLPEPDTGEVLVWLTGGRCAFDEWHMHREDPTGMGGPTMDMGLMWRDYDYEDITHWQPLPAAPAAQGDEQ